MPLFAVGVSHHTAPLAVRERLAIPSRDLSTLLPALRGRLAADELAVLSTCNRTELYLVASEAVGRSVRLAECLASCGDLRPDALQPHLYIRADQEAAAHLFRVSAGLDSMVLGESEITAQVKQAYLTAQAHGTVGPVLHRLFQKALHSTKLIRSRTAIADGQASIGSVVATLAKQVFGARLSACDALLWGAGKAAEATARHVIKSGIRQLWIVSRTQANAQDLASLCRSGWLSWEQGLKHVAHVDIAIVCTQAPHYVIDADDFAPLHAQRGTRPLLLVDLSVPRNVDPALSRFAHVQLHNIDDLQAFAQVVLAQRREERVHCETLIRQQVEHLYRCRSSVDHREGEACSVVEAYGAVSR